ncbi:DDB1- and CUL4-associated factor 6-like [Phymastichus coffea]|uniref:DDB1- and CUL4-associated factor 6-like n=1 Tax=Phymastichus coffea TaxID=108790 RepID=UPI00273BBC64|nr:DDB1- and CUL4-associated factor 6-like [Phymastichus coffea]
MRRNRSNVFRDIYNQPCNENTRVKLYNSSKSSLQLVQRMSLLKRLKVHYGCVNSICWNNTGELILSGSDDQHLVLTNTYNYQVLTNYKTSHKANIFSAKFLPNNGDHRIVSCSGDGIILYTDLMRKTETFNNQFTCHSGTTYEIATIPTEPHSFLSCGEDGTVRWFDLRIKDKCNATRCKEDILILCQKAITALSVNPVLSHQIAIGCSDSTVRTFDRRMLRTPATGWVDNGINGKPLCTFTVPEFEGNSCRITSLSYSPDGHDVLVSYSSDHLYLFSLKEQGSTQLKKELMSGKNKGKKPPLRSPQPVRRLRLRGDWSDTGPDARPEREGGRHSGTEIAQARPVLHTSLMQRMTDVLSRMLNDPATRAALSSAGDESIENVIDQQNIINRTVNNNEDTNQENSSNQIEISNGVENELASTNTESTNTLEINPEIAENSQLAANEANDQDNPTLDSSYVDELPVPMDIEHNQSEERSSEVLSLIHSEPHMESINVQNSNETESPTVESNSSSSNMMENLQDRLTTMRDGFLERHGTEPAVKLTYSDKSSTSATISLGVADEVTRDGYQPEACVGPSSSNYSAPGPSNSNFKPPTCRITHEAATDEDVYNDSDDEDFDEDRRAINPIETEMDEAIENVRAAQGLDSLDDNCLSDLQVKQKYMGHRNARTMIKEANFWGNDFVMSGSDCGHVFIWDRESAKLCMLLEADQHVVNCVQPHPFLPMLATSGIDYDVKLWAPINEESNFDEKFAEDLKKRNAVMLEETKDTITVPAVFMIRMLACLNQIRRGRGRHARRSGDEDCP